PDRAPRGEPRHPNPAGPAPAGLKQRAAGGSPRRRPRGGRQAPKAGPAAGGGGGGGGGVGGGVSIAIPSSLLCPQWSRHHLGGVALTSPVAADRCQSYHSKQRESNNPRLCLLCHTRTVCERRSMTKYPALTSIAQ